MKKPGYVVLAILVATSMVLLSAGQSQAITSKSCFNCHTMHNSQDGSGMLLEYRDSTSLVDGDPQGALIRYTTCAGCHINSSSGATVVAYTPIVHNVTGYPADTVLLAGGNFYHASVSADKNKAHNCAGITTELDIPPPGFKEGYTDPSKQKPVAVGGTGDWGPNTWTQQIADSSQLTCAGEYGCHGDRTPGNDEFAAIRGSHHTNPELTSDQLCNVASTVPTSYRFLAGIKGVEQNNGITETAADSYEYGGGLASKHNGYYGVDRTATGADITATISYLCAECHGNFHNDGATGSPDGIGTGSPWLRHPTDMVRSKAVGTEFNAYTTYDPVVPVGYTSVASGNTSGMPADWVVLCLSCHRAHGSGYGDLLRWEYVDDTGAVEQPATKSCRTCHTAK